MATLDSVQYARQTADDPQKDPLETNELHGRVRVAFAHYSNVGKELAQNDFVNLFQLPSGRVRLVGVAVRHEAMGTNVTMDIGFAGTENAIVNALNVAAAGASFLVPLNIGTVLTGGPVIQAKLEAANPADDKDFWVALYYVVD